MHSISLRLIFSQSVRPHVLRISLCSYSSASDFDCIALLFDLRFLYQALNSLEISLLKVLSSSGFVDEITLGVCPISCGDY